MILYFDYVLCLTFDPHRGKTLQNGVQTKATADIIIGICPAYFLSSRRKLTIQRLGMDKPHVPD